MNVKPLHLELDAELVEKVDEFRWKNRIDSRKETIQWLLRAILAQNPRLKNNR